MFYNLLEAKYKRDLSTNDVFVVRAIKGQIDDRRKLRKILSSKLEIISCDKTIWGLKKGDVNNNALSDMMLKWQPANLQVQGMDPFYLAFKVKEVIYDDKEQIYIRPDAITF